MSFKHTAKQDDALRLLSSPATHIQLFGGSRSGKTFILLYAIIVRALAAANSRHAVFRLHFNHVKQSIVMDTFPKVMRLCFPDVRAPINKVDWFAEYPNGSQIWFGGLDEKDRTEKILGQEYATIYLVEISQLTYAARNIALTRLAQNCEYMVGNVKHWLRLKMYYDCNPPSKVHWSYKLFHKLVDPENNAAVSEPHDFASMLMNPKDNLDNLPPQYLKILEGLPRAMKQRFLDGLYLDKVDGALWSPEVIDRGRVPEVALDTLQRIVVAVDPPGSSGAGGTEAGIVGVGIRAPVTGHDKAHGFVLADKSQKAMPDDWARIAVQLYRDLQADCIVAEKNYGGEMVEATIKHYDPNVPVRMVNATRGKRRRAEPISVLYDNDRVSHVGMFPEMEDEMCTYVEGETKESPNRMDAVVWGLTELFGIGIAEFDSEALTFGSHVLEGYGGAASVR